MIVLPDFTHPGILLWFSIYYASIGLAALLGRAPERWGALILSLAPFLQNGLYTIFTRPVFSSVDWVLVATDAATAAALCLVAFNADRVWPVVAVCFVNLSLLSHVSRGFTSIFEASYAQFNFLPTLVAAVILLVGAAACRIRTWMGFEDRSWVPYAKYSNYRKMADTADL